MSSAARRRVIVGVTGSLTNLRALRHAVSIARDRNAVLHAVNVWENDQVVELPTETAHETEVLSRMLEVHQAFAEALGGLPHDVDIRFTMLGGRAKHRLVEFATRDSDLLVVGTRIRPWWRPSLTGSVARHCVRHARCPVLVVPPDEMARQALTRRNLGLDAPSFDALLNNAPGP